MIREDRETTLILKGDNLEKCDSPLIIEHQEFYKVVLLKRNHGNLLGIHDRQWSAWLSSHNLTYGIVRNRMGSVVKGISCIQKYVFHTLSKISIQAKNSRTKNKSYMIKNR